MALWYVDTTAVGANDGSWGVGGEDAWVDITSAITNATYNPGDIIHVRGNGQIHTIAADKNFADDGTFGNPIIMRGDAAVIWGGDSGVRPIMDFAGNNTDWVFSGDDYWRIEYIEFRDGEGQGLRFNAAEGNEVHNCTWTDVSNETPSQSMANIAGGVFIEDCVFGAKVSSQAIRIQSDVLTTIKNCTIDNAAAGISCYSGHAFLENVEFGGTIANTTDIQVSLGIIRGRNVKFNAVTEVGFIATSKVRPSFVAIEDYNGVKGAWKKWYYHGTMESFSGPLTPDGQRAGGSYWVIKTVANGNGSIYAPLLCRYWPVYVALGGSGSTLNQDVTVWIQPDNGDASVPDTQGADADVWVEVAAWNNVTGEYDYYDSRDKAAQNAQVDETWGDIVVENVDIGATGWIIIRIYCISTDTFYIDRVESVA